MLTPDQLAHLIPKWARKPCGSPRNTVAIASLSSDQAILQARTNTSELESKKAFPSKTVPDLLTQERKACRAVEIHVVHLSRHVNVIQDVEFGSSASRLPDRLSCLGVACEEFQPGKRRLLRSAMDGASRGLDGNIWASICMGD